MTEYFKALVLLVNLGARYEYYDDSEVNGTFVLLVWDDVPGLTGECIFDAVTGQRLHCA